MAGRPPASSRRASFTASLWAFSAPVLRTTRSSLRFCRAVMTKSQTSGERTAAMQSCTPLRQASRKFRRRSRARTAAALRKMLRTAARRAVLCPTLARMPTMVSRNCRPRGARVAAGALRYACELANPSIVCADQARQRRESVRVR